MKNVKTQTQIFKEVGYKLHEAGMKGRFCVSNWADWCIRVGVITSDFKDFEEIKEHYEADVAKLNGDKLYGRGAISSLWTDAYVNGVQPTGCCFIKLPKSQEYDLLRYRISSIETQIKRAGYEVESITYCKYFWHPENGKVIDSPALCFNLRSKELDEWRDEQYQTHLYENEAECEEERRREAEYAEYQFCH